MMTLMNNTEPRDRLQRPLRDLRISVMDRCNFRCPYCMPQSVFHDGYRFLGSKERLSFDEILRITRVAANLGLRKIRITGGEPLLRPNLADLIGDLGAIEGIDDIALTTNGILLAKYATELKAAGLSRITVSLDSLDPEVFASMSGGFGGVAQVLEGIEAARAVGLTPIKINTVVQRGVNDHTVLDLIERFRGTGVIVRLIEFMDVGNRNQWDESLVVPSAELAARIHARLASDGKLYTCLFASVGIDLRTPLRQGASDEELVTLLRGIWENRRDRYSEQRAELRSRPEHKVEMFHVGG